MDAIQIFTTIFSLSLVRYFLIAGIPFILFYFLFKRRFANSRIQKRFAKKKDFIREILHSLSSSGIFTVIALLLLATPLRDYTQAYADLGDYPLWYFWLSVALSLIIHDTYFYWMHRLMHNPKIYRRTHLLHHKSVTPSPWASYSFHWAEAIVEGLVLVPILLLLPMHDSAVLAFTISSFAINVYGHLGYEIAPKVLRGSWLFQVINTSTHHNMHHSHFNGNYGLYFRFWDRLMNTELPGYVANYDKLQQRRFAKSKAAKGGENLAPIEPVSL